LGAPITAKQSGDGAAPGKGVRWAHSCMQGWRARMEDAHFAIGTLDGHGWEDTAAFGVMDGHGGREVAVFCRRRLPAQIAKGPRNNPKAALVDAFHRMDEILEDGDGGGSFFAGGSPGASAEFVGCTAVVCLVRRDAYIVANAGDSRVVLSRRGKAIALSEDHKPNLPGERDRIRRAGGTVERQQFGPHVQYRVNGNLNLSRSIGDLEYKKAKHLPPDQQMICATPDVITMAREAGDEFLVLACDGVWEVLENQEVVDFVRARLPAYRAGGQRLSGLLEEVLDTCVSPDLSATMGLGGDNMTIMLVMLDDMSGRGPGVCSEVLVNESPRSEVPSPDLETSAVEPDGMLCFCRPFA